MNASLSAYAHGSYILCDRLWQNSGIVVTTTTSQSFGTPVALPSRDQDDATSANGVMAGLEVSTATTNGAAVTTITCSYTNSAGTAGRTGTITSFPATAVAGTFVQFELAAGDKGVRSVESITLGTSLGAGAVHVVLYRQIVAFAPHSEMAGDVRGPVELGMPDLSDSSCLFFIYG